MKTLKFQGHSDDIFGEYKSVEDEESIDGDTPVRIQVGDALVVYGLYVDGGVWMVGISQVDDGVPIPDWPMRWKSETYSIVLEIDVPDETEIIFLDRKKECSECGCLSDD